MVAKKKPAKKKATKKGKLSATSSAKLKFDPRHFTDPGPDAFRNLSAAVVKQLELARNQFIKQVSTIIRGR